MAYRILLVEDEFLVADMRAEILSASGYEVVGPFARVAPAANAAATAPIDAAILDINVAGELVYPVADRLADRGIPYAFLSGHDHQLLAPNRHKPVRAMRKPFQPEDIAPLARRLLKEAGPV